MKKLTVQELYDRSALHLLTQCEPCRDFDRGSYGCKYRGPHGMKCAIGAVIPDSTYLQMFEGKSFDRLFKDFTLIRDLFVSDPEILDVGNALQSIHDFHSTSEWPWTLLELGHVFGLDVSKVERKINSLSEKMVQKLTHDATY